MGAALDSRTITAAAPALSVLVRARREAVESVREMTREALRGAGWAEDDVEDVVLAFSEALTNAIDHGSAPGAAVAVEVEVTPDHVRIRVCDRGRRTSTCPDGVPPAPQASSEHGRGLMIMRALADRFEIARSGRGTEVRLGFSPSRGRPAPTAA